MRLLRCSLPVDNKYWIPTLEEFSTDFPPYATLSHCWGRPNDEVSFDDLDNGIDVSQKPGYSKLRRCCELAFQAGLQYAWIDTCCIDKRSSAELSEAINSMFEWYSNSALCYAYLDDVITEEFPTNHATEKSSFRGSRWWTRGWTLQELIAPAAVLFFDQNWKPIETRNRLAWLVSEITGVEIEVLTEDHDWLVHRTSVAQKMSWAAQRHTTRQEDRAYSLMGLFGVNMPLLYGEGPRAFVRLQEEIMRTTADQSLFAWRGGIAFRGLLAASIEQFAGCGNIVSVDYNTYVAQFRNQEPIPNFSQTNYGTQIQLPMQAHKFKDSIHRAFLACTTQDRYPPKTREDFCSMLLQGQSGAEVRTYHRVDIPTGGMDVNWWSSWRKIEIKDLFVSTLYSTSYGFRKLVNRIVREVDFHLAVSREHGHTNFIPLYDSVKAISGATAINFEANRFNAQFPADDADAFMVLHVGSANLQGTQEDQSSVLQLPFDFFVLCGIYKGVLWTEVLIHSGVSTPESIRSAYVSTTDLGQTVRSAARTTTEKELRHLLSPTDIRSLIGGNRASVSTKTLHHHVPNAKFGVYITVDSAASATSQERYRALVTIKWSSFLVAGALYR